MMFLLDIKMVGYILAEKFALAGFPLYREAGAKIQTIDEKLRKAVQTYLDNGGEFNVISNDLLFISTMRTGLINMREMTVNPILTMREYLTSLGYNVSSNAYKNIKKYLHLKYIKTKMVMLMDMLKINIYGIKLAKWRKI